MQRSSTAGPEGGARAGPADVLALPRPVKLLAAGWGLAASSDWFTLWALLWVSGPRGWSGAETAALIVAARAPSMVGGIAGGMAVDRFGPRNLLLLDAVCRTAVMAGFLVAGVLDVMTYPVCVVLVALSGTTAPVSYSAVRTMVPALVDAAQLGRANTLLALGNALPLVLSASLVGPSLALVGLRYAFALPLLAMTGFLWIAWVLPRSSGRVERGPGPSTRPATRDADGRPGRDVARTSLSGAVALLLLSMGYYGTFGPFEPTLPFLIREHLHAGPATYGLLWGSVGVGCLLGLLAAPWLCSLPRPGAVNALIAVANSIVMLPLAFVGSTWAAVALCLGIGLLWSPYNAVEATALQKLAPARHLGKIFGLQRALAISALPVGAAVGSLALDHIGPGGVVVAASCAGTLVALIALSSRSLRARTDDVPPGSQP
jgi:predicted MFS family arabinose efflux permease